MKSRDQHRAAPVGVSAGKKSTMAKVTDKKIGVLLGGLSSEREVSLSSGRAVLKALEEKGYTPAAIDVGRDVAAELRRERIEVVFNALHGKFGEDGAIQGLLEIMGIPYTGSGILASAIGMDKVVSKAVFKAAGIAVGPYRAVARAARAGTAQMAASLGYPLFVKPSSEGSSVGVSRVDREEELEAAVDAAFAYDREILIERHIPGKEVQVAVVGERALGAIEIVPKNRFYDYEAKYKEGMSQHFFPARIPEAVYARTLEAGLAAHCAIGCRGYSRVDFIVDEGGTPWILEVNTLPGMTATSLLPDIARGVGIAFPDLVEEILRLALL